MLAVSTIRGVSFDGALTVKVFPSKVNADSALRVVPPFDVNTLSDVALFIVT